LEGGGATKGKEVGRPYKEASGFFAQCAPDYIQGTNEPTEIKAVFSIPVV